jgi:dephospho-CoA kinase
VLRCGLTGGIGSGKSTVAAGLAARGAVVVDADAVAREVVEPDGPAFEPLVARFGPGIIGPDGRVDRPALAAIVFSDADARAAINAITHPVIGQVVLERASAFDGTDRVVVLDVPLLTEVTKAFYRLGAVVVVDTPVDVAVARLVSHRGFDEAGARARAAAQISREERRALAGLVIDNAGGRDALEDEIDRAWRWLEERNAAAPA